MHGGKREGAGRPVGSGVQFKRAIQEYFTEEEVKNLITNVKKQAETKPEILKMLIEQLFGKAPQRLELTGKDGEKFTVNFDIAFKERDENN